MEDLIMAVPRANHNVNASPNTLHLTNHPPLKNKGVSRFGRTKSLSYMKNGAVTGAIVGTALMAAQNAGGGMVAKSLISGAVTVASLAGTGPVSGSLIIGALGAGWYLVIKG